MSLWAVVIASSVAAFALKLLGYLIPQHWLEGERTSRVAVLIPVALLAALVVVQTLGSADGPVLDARLVAVAVAIGLLMARANFLVVVVAAAAVAAALRAAGWG